MKKVNFFQLPEEISHGGTAQKRVLIRKGDALSPLIFLNDAYIAKGSQVPAHVHDDMEEIFYVQEGEGFIILDGKKEKISSGDCMIVPPGQSHSLVNERDEALHFICFGVKVRDEVRNVY
ncbi:MAG: cupin domain-containing protein [Vulcanimicrobiota bacterium]